MATLATTFPRARPRASNQLVGGRAGFPEIYFVKHIDNSHLRREVDVEKRRDCYVLLALGVMAFAFLLLLTWQHFQGVRQGYQIEESRAQIRALVESRHQLRLEQASLEDPGRIDVLARRDLGLTSPEPGQFVRVRRAGESPTE